VIVMNRNQNSPICEEQIGLHIDERSETLSAHYSTRDLNAELHSLDDGLNIAPDLQHLSQDEAAGVLRWLRCRECDLRVRQAREQDTRTFTRKLSREIDQLDLEAGR
jgi:hypothetical protein